MLIYSGEYTISIECLWWYCLRCILLSDCWFCTIMTFYMVSNPVVVVNAINMIRILFDVYRGVYGYCTSCSNVDMLYVSIPLPLSFTLSLYLFIFVAILFVYTFTILHKVHFIWQNDCTISYCIYFVNQNGPAHYCYS